MDGSVWVGLIGVLLGSGISVGGTWLLTTKTRKAEQERADALAVREALWEFDRCITEFVGYSRDRERLLGAAVAVRRSSFRLETLLPAEDAAFGEVVRQTVTGVLAEDTKKSISAFHTFSHLAARYLKKERTADQLLEEFDARKAISENPSAPAKPHRTDLPDGFNGQ